MDAEPDSDGLSHNVSAYEALFETLRAALADALAKGSRRLLAAYLQALLAFPDGCTRGETVLDPDTGEVLAQVPPLSEDKTIPKGESPGRPRGRRAHGGPKGAGLRDPYRDARYHRADGRDPHPARVPRRGHEGRRRSSRTAGGVGRPDRVEEGIDVLICHPRLVQTGLDLDGVPNHLLVRNRLLGVHDETGVAPVLAHRANPARQGRVHVLPEHAAGQRPEAGGEETAELPRRRGRVAGGRASRIRRRGRRSH